MYRTKIGPRVELRMSPEMMGEIESLGVERSIAIRMLIRIGWFAAEATAKTKGLTMAAYFQGMKEPPVKA